MLLCHCERRTFGYRRTLEDRGPLISLFYLLSLNEVLTHSQSSPRTHTHTHCAHPLSVLPESCRQSVQHLITEYLVLFHLSLSLPPSFIPLSLCLSLSLSTPFSLSRTLSHSLSPPPHSLSLAVSLPLSLALSLSSSLSALSSRWLLTLLSG